MKPDNLPETVAPDLTLSRDGKPQSVPLGFALHTIDRCPMQAALGLRGRSSCLAKRPPRRALDATGYACLRAVLTSPDLAPDSNRAAVRQAIAENLSAVMLSGEWVPTKAIPDFATLTKALYAVVDAVHRLQREMGWTFYQEEAPRPLEWAGGALSHLNPMFLSERGGFHFSGSPPMIAKWNQKGMEGPTLPVLLFVDRLSRHNSPGYFSNLMIQTAMLWPLDECLYELRVQPHPEKDEMVASYRPHKVAELQAAGVVILHQIKGPPLAPWEKTPPRPGYHCGGCDVASHCWAAPRG